MRDKGFVLVVDDDATVRNVSCEMLKALGFEAIGVSDGFAAMRAVHAGEEEYNFVLTDMSMPEMDGGELSEQIRKIHPAMPIALMSGSHPDLLAEQAARYRVDAALAKPFSIEVLREAIDTLLPAQAESGEQSTRGKVIKLRSRCDA